MCDHFMLVYNEVIKTTHAFFGYLLSRKAVFGIDRRKMRDRIYAVFAPARRCELCTAKHPTVTSVRGDSFSWLWSEWMRHVLEADWLADIAKAISCTRKNCPMPIEPLKAIVDSQVPNHEEDITSKFDFDQFMTIYNRIRNRAICLGIVVFFIASIATWSLIDGAAMGILFFALIWTNSTQRSDYIILFF